jgi:hypothetical protein
MPLPKHPVGERKATWFHGYAASIGLAHIAIGALMIWFHGVSTVRHWKDREF